jgi:hypothetical protein
MSSLERRVSLPAQTEKTSFSGEMESGRFLRVRTEVSRWHVRDRGKAES